MSSHKVIGTTLLVFLLIAAGATVLPASAYTPKKGDRFDYSETITVNNGQGSYTGYTDQTQVSGMEQINSVGGSEVSASYRYSFQYSNNQGSSTSSSSSGDYTWSSSSFTYLSGTDNQVGYSKPTYVWFAMDQSKAVGDTFYTLNTQFTVVSKNYSLELPTEGNKYVQTVQARGTGQYQRNDDYGVFTATYTWDEYFDPTTGYIVGYLYVEQDNGKYQGQDGSFTYTDTLYVTSTSYGLTPASAPLTSSTSFVTSTGSDVAGVASYVGFLLVALVLSLVVVAIVFSRRRRKDALPEHPYPPSTPPPSPSTPWQSKVDMGSRPPEQVVIRDVAKTKCRFCGTLIPTTVDTCPYCGGPRQ